MPHLRPSLLLVLLLCTPGLAQRSRCGTLEPVPSRRLLVPSDCGYLTNAPQPEYEPGCTYDIPVVFHVLQNTSGDGFLSLATLQDQIDILNEDFGAIPGTPGAQGTDARIRFHLAEVDPAGQPTSGVTYSTNNAWYLDDGSYWNTLAWDTNRYLNIYTNAVPCCYGYVPDFPSQGIAGQSLDRVVVWWEAVGRQATAGWPLNMGRTATHEVGHYLGLYHTFCGGCGSAQDCYGTGDLICDTPRQASDTSGCPASQSSCGSPDPTANYMDYTDDPCLTNFTPEQANRMRCTLENWRPNLARACGVGTPFCTVLPGSSGLPVRMDALGSTSVSAADLTFTVAPLSAGENGLVAYSPDATELPLGNGNLCLGTSTLGFVLRLPAESPNAGGVMTHVLDFANTPLPGVGDLLPGSTWHFQAWNRDFTPGGAGFNFSNAVAITFTQ